MPTNEDQPITTQGVDVQVDHLEVKVGRYLPRSYEEAEWRGTLPVDGAGRIGLSFNKADGEIVRLSLDLDSARSVLEMFIEYLAEYQERRSHSDTSSGMPSVEGSTPQEGKEVCPPAKSSAAC